MLTAIAFDKTGTLTVGKPKVTDVVAVSGDETRLLTIAAAVESRSAHPLAQAVVTEAKGRGLSWGERGDRSRYRQRLARAIRWKKIARSGAALMFVLEQSMG